MMLTLAVLAAGSAWADEPPLLEPFTLDDAESQEQAGFIVPDGHMPPPGECRFWFPDRTVGDQPPPVRCEDLPAIPPDGAIVVRSPEE